jgi:hypothetical protein
VTPSYSAPTSGADAARRLAAAKESSKRLEGAVSTAEGWWTVASAGLVSLLVAIALRAGHGATGTGPIFLLLLVPVVRFVATHRRSAERVHPRMYRQWYVAAWLWSMVVAVAAFWYWVSREPQPSGPLWLTSAVALVAALPLALVGARLVAGGRSR